MNKNVLQTTGLRVGDVMEDGVVFAGVSPNTGKPMFVLARNESLSLNWHEAVERAQWRSRCDNNGRTYRLPSIDELNILFENRDKIGGFSLREHWSSNRSRVHDACYQRFDSGYVGGHDQKARHAVRLIRD